MQKKHRTQTLFLSLFAILVTLSFLGCAEDPYAGECVPGTEFSDQATIIPSISPYVMCPVSTTAPDNKVYGNLLLNNCGRQTLTVSSSAISTDTAPEVFSELQLEKTEIAPGETSALRFTYISVDTLEHHGHIKIKSNASNEAELDIELVVRADEPFDGGFCPPIGAGASDAGSED